MIEEKKRFLLSLVVSGRVQGVGFRYFTLQRARAHGVTGWVKNRYDGKVEIEAEGPRGRLLLFLEDVRNGPASSRVTHVSEDWVETVSSRHSTFDVAY
jgi:acylphosphatase